MEAGGKLVGDRRRIHRCGSRVVRQSARPGCRHDRGPARADDRTTWSDELADWAADLHLEAGVSLHMSSKVTDLIGSGRVEAVGLEDGSRIEADTIVVGVSECDRMSSGWKGQV